jgi:DNA-binding transcriptional regulator YiaG
VASNDPVDVFRSIQMLDKESCWPWLGPFGGRPSDRRPYFQANKVRKLAYRWVWELVNGPIPDGLMVRHKCDNGAHPIGCCNIHHLELGTHVENMQDMTARGRHGLPATAVRAIRKLLDQGITQQEIADRYGVSRETISAISTGRVYNHIPEVPTVDPQDERQS